MNFHEFFAAFNNALSPANPASIAEMQRLCEEYEAQREAFREEQPANIFPVIDDRYELLKYRIWKEGLK
jgi:hypothetical protein